MKPGKMKITARGAKNTKGKQNGRQELAGN
jgi:hypothetical protein